MNERDRSNDRYEHMSPQELNAELHQVYAQIPKYEQLHGEEGIYDRMRRRQKSEHKEILMRIHSDLLTRSHISPFHQINIYFDFYRKNDFGDSLDSPRIEYPSMTYTSNDLLDLDIPESAGIFDPERAKEIERKAYRGRLSRVTRKREWFIQQGKQIPKLLLETEAEFQGEWLNQFLQKHKELP